MSDVLASDMFNFVRDTIANKCNISDLTINSLRCKFIEHNKILEMSEKEIKTFKSIAKIALTEQESQSASEVADDLVTLNSTENAEGNNNIVSNLNDEENKENHPDEKIDTGIDPEKSVLDKTEIATKRKAVVIDSEAEGANAEVCGNKRIKNNEVGSDSEDSELNVSIKKSKLNNKKKLLKTGKRKATVIASDSEQNSDVEIPNSNNSESENNSIVSEKKYKQKNKKLTKKLKKKTIEKEVSFSDSENSTDEESKEKLKRNEKYVKKTSKNDTLKPTKTKLAIVSDSENSDEEETQENEKIKLASKNNATTKIEETESEQNSDDDDKLNQKKKEERESEDETSQNKRPSNNKSLVDRPLDDENESEDDEKKSENKINSPEKVESDKPDLKVTANVVIKKRKRIEMEENTVKKCLDDSDNDNDSEVENESNTQDENDANDSKPISENELVLNKKTNIKILSDSENGTSMETTLKRKTKMVKRSKNKPQNSGPPYLKLKKVSNSKKQTPKPNKTVEKDDKKTIPKKTDINSHSESSDSDNDSKNSPSSVKRSQKHSENDIDSDNITPNRNEDNDSDNSVNSDKSVSIEKKPLKPSNDTNQKKSPKISKHDAAINRMKRYIRAAGLFVKYNTILKEVKSNKRKIETLLKVLEDAGLKGKPSLEKCKKLKARRERQKEIAELDVNNIISEATGRMRRGVSSLYQRKIDSPSLKSDKEEVTAETDNKKVFSRLKGFIDSEEDSD